MNLKENYELTNNFLKGKKLTDPILQSIVFLGFMYGLGEEEISACVFQEEGQPLSYMHCDYMRRALENGASLEEVKKIREMAPEEAKEYLHEVSSRKEWAAMEKLDERLKKMDAENENLKKKLSHIGKDREKERDELIILRTEKEVLEKKISDFTDRMKSFVPVYEHQEAFKKNKMLTDDMEGKYEEKIAALKKEAKEKKTAYWNSRKEIAGLKAQMRMMDEKHGEEVKNLVRERDFFQKELEKRKQRIGFFRKKEAGPEQREEKEKQQFFNLVVSGKFSAEQIRQLVKGLEANVPLEVLLTVARPENDADLMKEMLKCYNNLSVKPNK